MIDDLGQSVEIENEKLTKLFLISGFAEDFVFSKKYTGENLEIFGFEGKEISELPAH